MIAREIWSEERRKVQGLGLHAGVERRGNKALYAVTHHCEVEEHADGFDCARLGSNELDVRQLRFEVLRGRVARAWELLERVGQGRVWQCAIVLCGL